MRNGSRRGSGGRQRAVLRVACLFAMLALLGLASCSDGGVAGEDAPPESLADTPHVPPEQETFFTDVPVDGFASLSPDAQAAVAARANRARCDCGCFGHSVNACLHLGEDCESAIRIAERFVSEARLAARIAGGEPGPSEGGEPGSVEEGELAPAEHGDPDADSPDDEPGETIIVPAEDIAPEVPEPAGEARPPEGDTPTTPGGGTGAPEGEDAPVPAPPPATPPDEAAPAGASAPADAAP